MGEREQKNRKEEQVDEFESKQNVSKNARGMKVGWRMLIYTKDDGMVVITLIKQEPNQRIG